MKLDTVSPVAAGSNAAPAVPMPGAIDLPRSVSVPRVAQAAAPTQAPPGAQAAQQAARRINEFLRSSSASVEFVVDDQSREVVVRIVDSETKQLIRQMPSEEMLALSHALDRVTGLLLQQKA